MAEESKKQEPSPKGNGSHRGGASQQTAAKSAAPPSGPSSRTVGAKLRGPAFSKMSGDLIGVSILAFGVAAVIAVAYLAFARFSGGPDSAQVFETPPGIDQPSQAEQQAPQPGTVPDDSRITIAKEARLKGTWRAVFENSQAFLQIGDGVFQVTYVQDEEGRYRRFSRGIYEYDDENGRLVLSPKRELGRPDPVQGVSYSILTWRRYGVNVFWDRETNELYWVPAKLENRVGQTHPLFLFTRRETSSIKWQKQN